MSFMNAARLLAFGTAALSSVIEAQAPAATLNTEMDAYVERAVKDWHVAGLSIAVVKDGRIVFAKGYGVRELGKPEPVDTATMFAIASTTKAMTSAALGMLVDEKKVAWDDPVTKYLPTFQLYDPYATREVTLRDLLTHRAGLGNADYLWDVADLPTADIMSRVRLVKPAYSMRSSFIYQNVMYMMAGEVVRAASGMTWEKFVETRLFQPIGMKSAVASLSLVPKGANAASPHYRYGADTVRVIANTVTQSVGSAGAIWAPVSDMARWMIFLLDSGKVNGRRLLQPATYAELFTPQVIVPPDEFYPTMALTKPHWMTYGLGWFQHDYQGRMLNFHTGSLAGMVAIAGLIPDERFGVFVQANVDHAEVRHALMYKAIDLYLGNPQRDWSRDLFAIYEARRARADSARRAAEEKRIKGTRPSLALSKYAGVYEDPLLGRAVVTEQKGKLRIVAGPSYQGPLEHWQYDTFRVKYDDRWQGSDVIAFTIGDGIATELRVSGFTLVRAPDRKEAESR